MITGVNISGQLDRQHRRHHERQHDQRAGAETASA